MSTPYKGRHAAGAHRTPDRDRTGTAHQAEAFSRALRHPLASAFLIVAAAGASAAGFAGEPKPRTAVVSFTASPTAVVQSAELSANRNDTNAALSEARRVGVQRASALTHRQEAAAAALVKARKEAAAALVKARKEAAAALVQARVAAAERVARDKAREGLLARAQSDPRAVGRMLAADRGWGGEQYACLSSLWTKESGWRWNADNPSSDAYGIPQALPGSKMSSSGSDWASNPATQIKWGLGYIAGRYGTPCSAWAHSQAVNWY